MGIIDNCTYTISCEVCGSSEEKSILDKGSGWNGSSWQSPPAFTKFVVSWKGDGGREEPGLVSAKCAQCGKWAHVTSRYSQ